MYVNERSKENWQSVFVFLQSDIKDDETEVVIVFYNSFFKPNTHLTVIHYVFI